MKKEKSITNKENNCDKVWQVEDFLNTCVKVTPEQSEKLQKRLFEIGWCWFKNNYDVNFKQKPWLYLDKDFKITVSDSFLTHYENKEIKFEDIIFPYEFKFGDKINYIGEKEELKGTGIVFNVDEKNKELTIEYADGSQATAGIEKFELLKEYDICLPENINEKYYASCDPANDYNNQISIISKYYNSEIFKESGKTFEDIKKEWKDKKELFVRLGTEYHIKKENEIPVILTNTLFENEGYKESNGKLLTMELDAAFTKEMIKVLSFNKKSFGGKYSEGNHYKPMNPCELLSSAERHLLEIKEAFQNDNITDLLDDDNCSHIAKVAVNAMMTWIQLKRINNRLE